MPALTRWLFVTVTSFGDVVVADVIEDDAAAHGAAARGRQRVRFDLLGVAAAEVEPEGGDPGLVVQFPWLPGRNGKYGGAIELRCRVAEHPHDLVFHHQTAGRGPLILETDLDDPRRAHLLDVVPIELEVATRAA